jgi:hypothetical protein
MMSDPIVTSLSPVDRLELCMQRDSQHFSLLILCETCSRQCTLVFKTPGKFSCVSEGSYGVPYCLHCERWVKAVAVLNELFGQKSPILAVNKEFAHVG